MLMIVKAEVSGLFIVGINAIAQRNASLAGWVASLPLVTVLSIGWLAVDQRGDAEIVKFLTGVLWGLAPNAFLLAVTAAFFTQGDFPVRGVCHRACCLGRLFLRSKAVRSPREMHRECC